MGEETRRPRHHDGFCFRIDQKVFFFYSELVVVVRHDHSPLSRAPKISTHTKTQITRRQEARVIQARMRPWSFRSLRVETAQAHLTHVDTALKRRDDQMRDKRIGSRTLCCSLQYRSRGIVRGYRR